MPSDPDTRQKLGIVRNNLRMFGLLRTLVDILGYLFTPPPRDRFDRAHGVRTTGRVEKAQSGVTDPAALADAVKYIPISEQVMRHVLTHTARIADPGSLTFVDLGCGKGRALIMASWYPFQAIHGVELSPRYAEAAQQNVTGYLARPRGPAVRCSRVSVLCANALHYDLPATDLLVFMYRPFKGQVFQGVLDRLHDHSRRTGRRVLVAYVCPVEQHMLERHPGFAQLADYQVIVDEHRWSLWETSAHNPDTSTSPSREPAATFTDLELAVAVKM